MLYTVELVIKFPIDWNCKQQALKSDQRNINIFYAYISALDNLL